MRLLHCRRRMGKGKGRGGEGCKGLLWCMNLIGVLEGRRSSVVDRKMGGGCVGKERKKRGERENGRESGPTNRSGRRRVCPENPSRFPSSDETAGSAFEFLQRHAPPRFSFCFSFLSLIYCACFFSLLNIELRRVAGDWARI